MIKEDQPEMGTDIRAQPGGVGNDHMGNRFRGLEVLGDVSVNSLGSIQLEYAHIRQVVIQNKHPAMEKAANKIGNG